MSFWLTLAIQEAVELAEAYVNVSTIKPGLKSALENLIVSGQAVIAAIQSGT